VPAGVRFPTESSANINGVRVQVAPDGGVWFLESSADRVGVLRGTTITYWQLRPSDQLGANPVDFVLDGTDVWILESGQSQIPAGNCSIAKLDTVANQVTEWLVPGSIPAAFYKAPDGTYWVPVSGAALLNVNFQTGTATRYRSALTFAYADMAVAPDGTLWLADFGNNRIVRYVPGATEETSWNFFNPSQGRLNPTQVEIDDKGMIWMTQLSAGRLDRFDPATGNLDSFYGITNPIHFQFFQGKAYITSSQSAAAVNVIDPSLASPFRATLTPVTLEVRATPALTPVTSRTFAVPPTTFAAEATPLVDSDFRVASNQSYPGTLVTQVPVTQAYGIGVDGGQVWFGAGGNLVRVDLQTIGGPTDRSAPVANSAAGQPDNRIRIDITLSNAGSTPIAGDALYMYSPGAFAAKTSFSVGPGATQVLADAFGNIGTSVNLAVGSVRLRATTGNAADLQASVRTTRVTPLGAAYGYSLETQTIPASLAPGSQALLFTGARSTEVSIFGMYSMTGGSGTLTLAAPDGTVRATAPFTLAINTRAEFNPAASAFGVDPEPGDVIRVSVSTGSLQPYVNVLDLGTFDVAAFVPVQPLSETVVPSAGVLVGANSTEYVTDLFLSNPDPAGSAVVSVTYYPLSGPPAPLTQSVTLAPRQTQVLQNVLNNLFGLTSAQGSLFVSSSLPVAVGVRVGARTNGADYAGFAPAVAASAGLANATGTAFGLPQTAYRRTNLLFYNRGAAGSVTVTGLLADGTPAGQIQVPLGDHSPGRLDSVFAAFGVTNQPGGRIRLDVPDGMNVYTWTATIDNITGDVDLAAVE